MTIGNLKAQFSHVIDDIQSGEEYVILKGKNKTKVAMIIQYNIKKENTPIKKRSLGKDKGKILIKDDFDILPEDIFIGQNHFTGQARHIYTKHNF